MMTSTVELAAEANAGVSVPSCSGKRTEFMDPDTTVTGAAANRNSPAKPSGWRRSLQAPM
ncbi:hypothetical protein P3T76_011424 [Phytophthora citrophthora]|uniref:Uncharacterized protein n=1 Tax=Phytophthora citrophthora TaxID=4793 RepID=A0AAD9LFA4_9STRA|nr:hypothetical protein P3T76_011424 [Phytophthora citrophthora]